MSCRDVKEELSAYLDGELSGARKDGVARHLDECYSCRSHANQLVELITLTKRASYPAPRKGFVDEVMNDIGGEEKKLSAAAMLLKNIRQFLSLLFLKPAFYYLVLFCLLGRCFLSPAQDSRGDYIALSDTAFQKTLSQRSVGLERLGAPGGREAKKDRGDNNSQKEDHYDVHKKDVPLRVAVRGLFLPDCPGCAGPLF